MAPIDLSGIIPPEFSLRIMQEATQQSAVLQLANTIPMGTKTQQFPVPRTFPQASWVATPGGRKPVSELSLSRDELTAEELAVTVLIPDQFLEDSEFGLWSYAQPLIAEAFADKLDDTVLWGTDAPATFPAGGLAATAITVPAGADAVATVNDAMAAIEANGLAVTGHTADVSVRASLRGMRDLNGAFLLGTTQVNMGTIPTIYDVPVAYRQFEQDAPADFITGAWRYLIVGIRQDLRFRFSSEATIIDGETIHSLFQDNMTALKVHARYGCVLVRPVTRRTGEEGVSPFAMAEVAGGGESDLGEGSGETSGGPGAAVRSSRTPKPKPRVSAGV